jgi:hypothetical protein
LPRLKDELADQHTDLARYQMDVSRNFTERLELEASDLKARDLPGAIRSLDVGSGIHSDKARDLRGDPSAVVEHRSASDIMRKLKQMGLVIEAEGEEVESPPELPPTTATD